MHNLAIQLANGKRGLSLIYSPTCTARAGVGLPLTKQGPRGAKVLEDSQLAEVFGIELADAAVSVSRGKTPVARKKLGARVRKKAGPKAAARASVSEKSARARKRRA